MNSSFKNISALYIITAAIACAALFVSCNKSSPGSTVFKCVTCANGGICENDTCHCIPGFDGVTCETQIRQKFTGSWNVTEKVSTYPSSSFYSITIFADTGITGVVIENLISEVSSLTVKAYAAGDSLVIPMQSVNGAAIIGKGIISPGATAGQGGTIIMKYAVKYTSGTLYDFGYYSAIDSPSIWTAPGLL